MQDPFVVAFVVGVTPSKWARMWGERMSRPLELRALPQAAALAALADGSVHVALLRLPDAGLPGVSVPGVSVPGAGLAGAGVPGAGSAGVAGAGVAGAGLPGAGVTGPSLPAYLSAIPLYSETAVVVAPKDHPVAAFESVTLEDLVGEVVLGAPTGSGGPEPAGEPDAEPDWAGIIALVAANVGVAVMPQPVARALSRRDVTATPITGTPETRVGLVWVTARQIPETEEFIGIVRGRTANSSRGAREPGATGAAGAREPGANGAAGAPAKGAGRAGGDTSAGQSPSAKGSSSRSGTPSRRDPRASRARRR